MENKLFRFTLNLLYFAIQARGNSQGAHHLDIGQLGTRTT
jgi:hypothetical protein